MPEYLKKIIIFFFKKNKGILKISIELTENSNGSIKLK
jgi:hypothetical protein